MNELVKYAGAYFLQGVSPSTRAEMNIQPQSIDPINGNDMFLRQLVQMVNYTIYISSASLVYKIQEYKYPFKKHLDWKIELILKQSLQVSKEAIITGQDATINEQIIGFQNTHEDKKRINEKR